MLQHVVLPTRLPLADFYTELVETQRVLARKHLGASQIWGAARNVASLLAHGQTNFLRMLFKFNSVYDPKLQLADHARPVERPRRQCLDHPVRLGAEGQSARHVADDGRVVERAGDGPFGVDGVEAALAQRPSPRLLTITGASNVTGWIPPLAAIIAAAPGTGVTRLPPTPGSRGEVSVASWMMRTRAGSIPSSCAMTRWSIVCCPPPWSVTPVRTVTSPRWSRVSSRLVVPRPTWRTPSATPRPWPSGLGSSQRPSVRSRSTPPGRPAPARRQRERRPGSPPPAAPDGPDAITTLRLYLPQHGVLLRFQR